VQRPIERGAVFTRPTVHGERADPSLALRPVVRAGFVVNVAGEGVAAVGEGAFQLLLTASDATIAL
jgi:hypothetical protein